MCRYANSQVRPPLIDVSVRGVKKHIGDLNVYPHDILFRE